MEVHLTTEIGTVKFLIRLFFLNGAYADTIAWKCIVVPAAGICLTLVQDGNCWDAIASSIQDNMCHVGQRLTRLDMQHNTIIVLREKPELSNRSISEICGVSDKTVGSIARELEIERRTRLGVDGKRYEVRNSAPEISSGFQASANAGDRSSGPGHHRTLNQVMSGDGQPDLPDVHHLLADCAGVLADERHRARSPA